MSVATRLYRQGLTDFLSVLDAQRSLYAAEDKLAETDRDTALALVALFKSLGGGWQTRTRDPAMNDTAASHRRQALCDQQALEREIS